MSGPGTNEVSLSQGIAYAGAMLGGCILVLVALINDVLPHVAGTFGALLALIFVSAFALQRMGWSSKDLPGRFALRLRGSSPETPRFGARAAQVLFSQPTEYSRITWSSRAADSGLFALVALELAGMLGGLVAALNGVLWQTLGFYAAVTAVGLAIAFVLLRLMLWQRETGSPSDDGQPPP